MKGFQWRQLSRTILKCCCNASLFPAILDDDTCDIFFKRLQRKIQTRMMRRLIWMFQESEQNLKKSPLTSLNNTIKNNFHRACKIEKKKIKIEEKTFFSFLNFVWIYFCESLEIKSFASTYFCEFGQNSQNSQKLIHARIYPLKVVIITLSFSLINT